MLASQHAVKESEHPMTLDKTTLDKTTLGKPQTDIETFLDVACHRSERETIVNFVKAYQASNPKNVSPAAALAVYVINDLFSESSSDEANVNRVTTNLEAAADDLLTMSKMLKGLV